MGKIQAFRGEKGQSMVEFAMILPLFLLLIFFIIDFGWYAYQRSMFDQGYAHAGWNVSRAQLGDTDPIDEVPAAQVYTGSAVETALADEVSASSLWGFIPANLTVSNARARLYNQETSFAVPGRLEDDVVPAISRTRYMELEADLTYRIYPLTFVGHMLFGSYAEVDKTLSCTRVTATVHRSA